MAETPKDVPLRVQMDQESIRRAVAEVSSAVEGLVASWNTAMEARREAMEVAALFQLYRQYRYRPDGAPPRAETLAQLMAAVHGYRPEYLMDLAAFGGWLADAAGKEVVTR